MVAVGGLFLAVAMGVLAHAEDTWQRISLEEQRATGPEKIEKLLLRYPGFLNEAEVAGAEFVAARRDRFRYLGPSSCPKGDPRLVQEVTSLAVRMKGSAVATGLRSGVHTSGLEPGDPCAGDLPPQGRWELHSESRSDFETPEEISGYLRRQTSNFPGILPHHVERVAEMGRTFYWKGRSSCPAGDPRLVVEERVGFVKFRVDQSVASFASIEDSTRDPCDLETGTEDALASIISDLRHEM